MKKLFLLLFIAHCSLFIANAQVIKYLPLYPTVNDSITIIYDASKGNAGLNGETNVYAHTGVLTSFCSTNHRYWN